MSLENIHKEVYRIVQQVVEPEYLQHKAYYFYIGRNSCCVPVFDFAIVIAYLVCCACSFSGKYKGPFTPHPVATMQIALSTKIDSSFFIFLSLTYR